MTWARCEVRVCVGEVRGARDVGEVRGARDVGEVRGARDVGEVRVRVTWARCEVRVGEVVRGARCA